MDHRSQAVVEDRLDLGNVVLQGADSRGVLFGRHAEFSILTR
jgi:hypothetical protein